MDKNQLGKGLNSPKPKKIFTRKKEDAELKKQLILGPEAFITQKGSDEYLDKLSLKVKLFGRDEFTLDEYVSEAMTKYESKFHKYWFYRLADLYEVPRSVMDVYVKPDFVRKFIVQFVYGRFPYLMLRTLRKNKNVYGGSNNKLYHYLTKDASEQLDIVIDQVYEAMNQSDTPLEFKMTYSQKYKVYFQTELF